jgi:hypothetical protein
MDIHGKINATSNACNKSIFSTFNSITGGSFKLSALAVHGNQG